MPLVNLDDEEIAPELVSQQTQHHSTGSTDDTDGTSIQIGTDIDTFFKPLAQHRYWGDKKQNAVQILMPTGEAYDMPMNVFLGFENTEQFLRHLMPFYDSSSPNWKLHFPLSLNSGAKSIFFNVTDDALGVSHIVPKEFDNNFLNLLCKNRCVEILPDTDNRTNKRGAIKRPPKFSLTNEDTLEFKVECIAETETVSSIFLRVSEPSQEGVDWININYTLKKGTPLGRQCIYLYPGRINLAYFSMSYKIQTNKCDYDWINYIDPLVDKRPPAEPEDEDAAESITSELLQECEDDQFTSLGASRRTVGGPRSTAKIIKKPVDHMVGSSSPKRTAASPSSATKKRPAASNDIEESKKSVRTLTPSSGEPYDCLYCCDPSKEELVVYACGHMTACVECYTTDIHGRASIQCLRCFESCGSGVVSISASVINDLCKICGRDYGRERSVIFRECMCCETCLECFEQLKHFQKCTLHRKSDHIVVRR